MCFQELENQELKHDVTYFKSQVAIEVDIRFIRSNTISTINCNFSYGCSKSSMLNIWYFNNRPPITIVQ